VEAAFYFFLFLVRPSRERVIDMLGHPSLFLEGVEQAGLVWGRLPELLQESTGKPKLPALRVPMGQSALSIELTQVRPSVSPQGSPRPQGEKLLADKRDAGICQEGLTQGFGLLMGMKKLGI
jgi:hypothetical protein